MLTMNETEAAYARFLSETNCKRLPKPQSAYRIRRFDGQFGNDLREGLGRRP